MARSTVSDEIKAAALADLHAGEQPAVVAARYGLPGATVRKWKERVVTSIVTDRVTPVTTIRPTAERQQERIGDLVIRLLEAKLRASERLAEHITNNAAWLDEQTAGELAVLGEYLDRSAFALGDRLAGRGRADDDAVENVG